MTTPSPAAWTPQDGWLCKTFHFKRYRDGLDFVQRVAALAEEQDHHPDLLLGYRRVEVRYRTHCRGAVTELDFAGAAAVDALDSSMSGESQRTISPSERAKLDQVFMQVVLDVQAQVQQTKPAQLGNLAAMFHKETVAEALQGCAMLIAGWNQGHIDAAGLARASKALKALELPELSLRVERLREI